MNRMPLGMYMPFESVIHSIDARVKLVCFLALIVSVIITDTLVGYIVILSTAFVFIVLSRIPFKIALSCLYRLRFFLIIIFVMNALFFTSENILVSWWIFNISKEGILQGVHVVLRVVLVMLFSTCLTATTSPVELTKALESLFRPLRYVKIPVGQICMIISIAIQFIPVISQEALLIKQAQTARGARFESRRLIEKAKESLALVIPIFLSAIRRADELALAMEARGYRSANTPEKRSLKLSLREYAGFVVSAAVCALQIMI